MAIKMWKRLTASGLVMMGLVAADAANAHPRLVPVAQLRRLSADLMRSDRQDFFKVGRMKLERDVETINQPRSRFDTDVLIIDSSIQLQPDLSPLETPNLRLPKPSNQ
ncbi:hypothetical protein AB3R30_15280 [Leptolyngbyaceae cyanobacterium UHCC 1019]